MRHDELHFFVAHLCYFHWQPHPNIMTTTTLRLTDELKIRVTAAADAAGLTAHGFMLRAIESQTAEAEAQAAFEQLAAQRWRKLQRTGGYLTHDSVRDYAMALARGDSATPPKPVKPVVKTARARSA